MVLVAVCPSVSGLSNATWKLSHTIVHGLEIVDQCQNVLVSHRDSFEDGNLISNLSEGRDAVSGLFNQGTYEMDDPLPRRDFGVRESHHMFPSSHQPLIDNFCGIIPPAVDVYAFLYDRVGTRPQGLPGLVPTRLDLRSLWLSLGLGSHPSDRRESFRGAIVHVCDSVVVRVLGR